MSVVRCHDIDIYYERHGSGKPVLWISGSNGDLRYVATRGNGPLERAFDTIMYDQRGLGQTSKPIGPYSMADYADDAAALLDALGVARCHVVGVSFGGMVAQEFVLRHSARVDRLVLACTSSGGEGGSSWDLQEIHHLMGEDRLRAWLPKMDVRERHHCVALADRSRARARTCSIGGSTRSQSRNARGHAPPVGCPSRSRHLEPIARESPRRRCVSAAGSTTRRRPPTWSYWHHVLRTHNW